MINFFKKLLNFIKASKLCQRGNILYNFFPLCSITGIFLQENCAKKLVIRWLRLLLLAESIAIIDWLIDWIKGWPWHAKIVNYGFGIENFEKVYLGAITSQVPNPYPGAAQGIRGTPFILIYQNMGNFIKASKLYQRVVIFYID